MRNKSSYTGYITGSDCPLHAPYKDQGLESEGREYERNDPCSDNTYSDDTANKVAPLYDCLQSTINRARTAQILIMGGHEDLIDTLIKDMFVGIQNIVDAHSVNHS